jgi:hypothetical protein
MNSAELQTLKSGEGKGWVWLEMDVPELGEIEVGGEYEPAEWHGGRMCSSDFSLMSALVITENGAVDLTLHLKKSSIEAINDQARAQMDATFVAAQRQARDEARMVHA